MARRFSIDQTFLESAQRRGYSFLTSCFPDSFILENLLQRALSNLSALRGNRSVGNRVALTKEKYELRSKKDETDRRATATDFFLTSWFPGFILCADGKVDVAGARRADRACVGTGWLRHGTSALRRAFYQRHPAAEPVEKISRSSRTRPDRRSPRRYCGVFGQRAFDQLSVWPGRGDATRRRDVVGNFQR